MNNKILGNDFEKEVAQILKAKGFWVHIITPARYIGSQPADIIAVKNNVAMLVDCKTCSKDKFPISRIEQNQRLAFKKFKECGNMRYYLAIKGKDGIYFINLNKVDFNKKYIDLTDFTEEKNEDYSWK